LFVIVFVSGLSEARTMVTGAMKVLSPK